MLNVVPKLKVGILISPNVALMDIFGAHAVFGMSDNIEIHILWKSMDLLHGAPTFPIAATTTFNNCPKLDILVIGAVPPDVIADTDVINFLLKQASHDPYIISVCAGILLLGAAGLIVNKRVTTNFHILENISQFGGIPIEGGIVVKDEKLFTAGPATGGFEAALMVLGELRGTETAKLMELTIEYHPQPPFGVGTPELAGKLLSEKAKNRYRVFFQECVSTALKIKNINMTKK